MKKAKFKKGERVYIKDDARKSFILHEVISVSKDAFRNNSYKLKEYDSGIEKEFIENFLWKDFEATSFCNRGHNSRITLLENKCDMDEKIFYAMGILILIILIVK